MKKILLFIFAIGLANTLIQAQCTPDPTLKDSAAGVYPRPYDPVRFPNGGIKPTACIGKPYKYVLTAKIPDSLTITQFGFPIQVKIDTVKLDRKSTNTVKGLPKGMTYDCNPPNCVFPAKSMGCIYLYGTPTTANVAGNYDLSLEVTAIIQSPLGGQLSQKVDASTLAPGKYTLKLEPNNSTTCFVSSAKDKNENIVEISSAPNPTNGITKISFNTLATDVFDFIVTDIAGKIVYKETRQVSEGINTMDFDASILDSGLYIYSLGNEKGRVSNRLVVNH